MIEVEIMAAHGWYPLRVATRRDPNEADLSSLEGRLGARLPEDYRRFVARFGQGALRHGCWFAIREPCPWGQWGLVDQFLGFSADSDGSLPAITFDLFADRIPAGMLPIAEDPGGNLVLLAVAASRPRGSVWFWDHEHRPRPNDEVRTSAMFGDSNRVDNLYEIAMSFASFLEEIGERDAHAGNIPPR